jgi:hypothetical protein
MISIFLWLVERASISLHLEVDWGNDQVSVCSNLNTVVNRASGQLSSRVNYKQKYLDLRFMAGGLVYGYNDFKGR